MPAPPARTALVYGISIYDVSAGEGAAGTNNLTLTDDDALAMKAMLESRGWTVKAGIANTQVASESADATKAAMAADIAGLAGTDGQVLFYYSGHGTHDALGNSYIIPFGSMSSYSDMVSADELYAMFQAAGLHNVIAILDSCHSGGFVEEGSTVDAVPPIYGVYDNDGDIAYTWFVDSLGDAVQGYLTYSAGPKYVTLSAAGSGELSWESSVIGHGIFTNAILLAADDPRADLDGDGYLNTSELYLNCAAIIDATWNAANADSWDYVDYRKQYSDFLPHLSGTAREYALWETQ